MCVCVCACVCVEVAVAMVVVVHMCNNMWWFMYMYIMHVKWLWDQPGIY